MGINAKMSDNNGEKDYSVSRNVNVAVKYNNTEVSGGVTAGYSMSKGLDLGQNQPGL